MKKQAEIYLRRLAYQVAELDAAAEVYFLLHQEISNGSEFIMLAKYFFSTTFVSVYSNIIMLISKLLDTERPQKSFPRFLNYLDSNLGQLFPSFTPNEMKDFQKKIAIYKNQISDQIVVMEKIIILRNKHFAHFDQKYFDHPLRIVNKNKLDKKSIENLIATLQKMVTELFLPICESSLDNSYHGKDDFLFLKKCLERYLKVWKKHGNPIFEE